MDVLSNSYMPGDSRLIDHIVYELKSQGIFDKFRKECISDVDTKPAYQNLRQRVEGSVTGFLKAQKWRPDMNKNQVREMLRKNISESGFLETGVERIVDQVVNPKINTIFLPQVENVVYKYLGIEKPTNRNDQNDSNEFMNQLKIEVDANNLLPMDLESVSPESETLERKMDLSNDSQKLDDSKVDEDESPPFEPIEESISYLAQEENSIDSHLSGFSGLASHDSCQSIENSTKNSQFAQVELSNQDSFASKNSSDDHLSIVMSDDNDTKMDISEDSLQSKSSKNAESVSRFSKTMDFSQDSNSTKSLFPIIKTDSEKKVDKNDDKLKNDDKKTERSRSDKYKSKHDGKSDSKERRDDKDRKSDRDKKEHKEKDRQKDSKDRDKSRDKDRRDSKGKSEKDKNSKSESDKDSKNEKDKSKSSGNKSSSSNKDRNSSKKDSNSKDKDNSDTKYKSKSSSHKDSKSRDKSNSLKTRDESKSKSESSKSRDDSKSRGDSKSYSKSSSKSKSEVSDAKKDDKNKKSEKYNSSGVKHGSSNKKEDKDKKDVKRDSKKQNKDDHYSLKGKRSGRRSTDRDSSDGHSGTQSSSSSLTESSSSQPQQSQKSALNSGCGSSESGNSDPRESDMVALKTPVTVLTQDIQDSGEIVIRTADHFQSIAHLPEMPQVKLIKPKFASNIFEARRLMKIRKQLGKIEKQKQIEMLETNATLMNNVFLNASPTTTTDIENHVITYELVAVQNVDGTEPDNDPESSEKRWPNILKKRPNILRPNAKQNVPKLNSVTTKTNVAHDDGDVSSEKEQSKPVKSTFQSKNKHLPINEVKSDSNTVTQSNVVEHDSTKDPTSPLLESSVISKASWDLLEAKLNQENLLKVNYDSYLEQTETPESAMAKKSSTDSENSDGCLYFSSNSTPRTEKYLEFIKKLIKNFEESIESTSNKPHKRKNLSASESVITKCTVNLTLNNEALQTPVTPKRQKLAAEVQSDVHNNNKINNHLSDVISHSDKFALPLSPAESDKSFTAPNEKKIEKNVAVERTKRNNNTLKAVSRAQRYSSDDLYKPRLRFSSSRRRNKDSGAQ